jgi:hypothetical protein
LSCGCMESASGEPRWPAFTRTPYSYPGSLFTVLEARSRRPFGAWPRRVAVRRRRTLIFGRRTSTERLAAAPRPHRVRRRLAPELAAGVARVKSAKSIGVRSGQLAHPPAGVGAPERAGHRDDQGRRDRAIIAVLLGCALSRPAVAALTDGRWAGGFRLEATVGKAATRTGGSERSASSLARAKSSSGIHASIACSENVTGHAGAGRASPPSCSRRAGGRRDCSVPWQARRYGASSALPPTQQPADSRRLKALVLDRVSLPLVSSLGVGAGRLTSGASPTRHSTTRRPARTSVGRISFGA